MLENTIAEINTRIRLFDSNPSPNSLKMASQLEKQKQDWQKQLDSLEAKYKEYKQGANASGSTAKTPNISYPRFSYAVRTGRGSPEEKKLLSNTISDFMKNAKDGDVYRIGGGVGSGGDTFSITGSGSKMKIRSSRGRSVLMNRTNVKSWILNGATLIKRK